MGLTPALLFFIVGLGVLLAGRMPLGRVHGAGLPALAWAAGLTALTWAVMLPALASERFYLGAAWALGAAGAAAIAWRWREARERLRRRPIEWPEVGLARGVLALLILCVAYNVWMVCSLALHYPIIGYDAIGNYAMKAQMWFTSRELFPALLLDEEFVMYHRRYPPAIPVAEMVWSLVLGDWDDVRLKWFFLVSWLALGGLMFALVRRRASLLTAWLMLTLWAALPYHLRELHGGATDAYPEFTHALALLAGLTLARELGRERDWARAALMAFVIAGSVLIKQEGLFFIALALVYLIAVKAPWRNAALVAAFAIVNVAIWKLAGRGVPDFMDESYLSLHLSPGEIFGRVKQMAAFIWSLPHGADRWGLVMWALPVVWAFKLWRVPRARWLSLELGAALALMACYTVVLLNTPLDFAVHLETTLHRLIMHVLPLLFVATFDGLDEARPFAKAAVSAAPAAPAPTPPAEPASDNAR